MTSVMLHLLGSSNSHPEEQESPSVVVSTRRDLFQPIPSQMLFMAYETESVFSFMPSQSGMSLPSSSVVDAYGVKSVPASNEPLPLTFPSLAPPCSAFVLLEQRLARPSISQREQPVRLSFSLPIRMMSTALEAFTLSSSRSGFSGSEPFSVKSRRTVKKATSDCRVYIQLAIPVNGSTSSSIALVLLWYVLSPIESESPSSQQPPDLLVCSDSIHRCFMGPLRSSSESPSPSLLSISTGITVSWSEMASSFPPGNFFEIIDWTIADQFLFPGAVLLSWAWTIICFRVFGPTYGPTNKGPASPLSVLIFLVSDDGSDW